MEVAMRKKDRLMKNGVVSKILTGAFVGMIMFASVNGVKVYADNTNSNFSFNFENGGTDETLRRYKDDPSAAWMSCSSCDGYDVGYKAFVYGYEDYHSNDPECCSYAFSFSEDTVKYMKNTVIEDDKHFATIVGELKGDECVAYSGECSPDNCSGY